MRQKLHLCLDLRLIRSPGIGRFLKTLLFFFLKEDSLELSCLCYQKDIFLIEALEETKKLKKIMCKSKIYSFREQIELVKKIPNCDLFWSPHFNIPIFPTKAKDLIVTIHDIFHLTYLTSFYKRFYAKLIFFFLNKKAKYITTCSKFTYNEYINFLGKKRINDIFVIHHAVVCNKASFISIEEKKDRILYVGSLQKRKNLFRLIRAYDIIKPKEKLCIVGPKFGRSIDTRIFDLVKQKEFLKNNVEFIDFVSEKELSQYYSSSKVFVFPSLYEGFGYPPLEAMKNGTPTIVANIPCLKEICGDASYFFNAYDEEDMARVIYKVLQDQQLQRALQLKGLIHVEQYNLSKMKDNIFRVIYENSYCS